MSIIYDRFEANKKDQKLDNLLERQRRRSRKEGGGRGGGRRQEGPEVDASLAQEKKETKRAKVTR